MSFIQRSAHIVPSTYKYDELLASYQPAGWWKLNDPVGSATAADFSGNGYTGAVEGGVTFGQDGPIAGGTAANFDGTTGYINLPQLINAIYGYTIVGWANVPPAGTHGAVLKLGDTTQGVGIGIGTSAGWDAAGMQASGLYEAINWLVGPVVTAGWHMLCLVVLPVGAFYVDGVLAVSTTLVPRASGAPTTISDDIGISTRFYGGDLAQVAFFRYALTASQISALYAAASH